jgi:hypothetical protein
MSADLSHSNNFVQHVMNKLISDYKTVFIAAGRTLKHVHLWSDGCGSQFKNKNQFYWLTTGMFKHGVRLTHHFFQSCHGKASWVLLLLLQLSENLTRALNDLFMLCFRGLRTLREPW